MAETAKSKDATAPDSPAATASVKAQDAPGGGGTDAGAVAAANAQSVENRVRFGVDSPVELDHKDELLAAAQRRAPSLTREFADYHELPDEYLQAIADGVEPPPPTNGPNPSTSLHFTPGGWQVVPLGTAPEDVSKGKGGYGPVVPG